MLHVFLVFSRPIFLIFVVFKDTCRHSWRSRAERSTASLENFIFSDKLFTKVHFSSFLRFITSFSLFYPEFLSQINYNILSICFSVFKYAHPTWKWASRFRWSLLLMWSSRRYVYQLRRIYFSFLEIFSICFPRLPRHHQNSREWELRFAISRGPLARMTPAEIWRLKQSLESMIRTCLLNHQIYLNMIFCYREATKLENESSTSSCSMHTALEFVNSSIFERVRSYSEVITREELQSAIFERKLTETDCSKEEAEMYSIIVIFYFSNLILCIDNISGHWAYTLDCWANVDGNDSS